MVESWIEETKSHAHRFEEKKTKLKKERIIEEAKQFDVFLEKKKNKDS